MPQPFIAACTRGKHLRLPFFLACRTAFDDKAARGLRLYDLPLILLVRLAVDRRFAGRGIGHALISEAFRISLRVADEVGCRCIITDAYRDRIDWLLS